MTSRDLPIVCALDSAAVEARKAELLAGLMARVVERHELVNGCRLQFAADGDILSTIALAVDAERQCCRFLTFEITVQPDGGPIWLDLTGPAGTREFLAGFLGA